MSDSAPLRPSRLLAELAAAIACVILLALIVTALIDWIRHVRGDEAYRQAQRDRHSFLCQVHAAGLPADPPAEDADMHQILRLLDAARAEVVAPHLLAKIQHFYTCATVTKIGFGGTELRSDGLETVRVLSGDVGELAKVQRYVESIAALFPAFPPDVRDEIARHVREITRAEADRTMAAAMLPAPEPVVEPAPWEGPGGGSAPDDEVAPGVAPIVEFLPAPWLLIVGADKTDDEALTQARAIEALVAETAGLDAQDVPLRLYRRGGWLRSALVFDSRGGAQDAFDLLLPHLRYGGVLRAEAEFCPAPRDADAIGDVAVVDCTG